jgi:uncharacterized protein YjdB
LLVAMTACTEPILPPLAVATCTVTPASVALLVGDTVQLRATALDAEQVSVRGATIAFSSSVPTVAQVVATSGVTTGVAPGTAQVVATCGTGSASAVGRAAVTVGARPAASVVFQSATVALLEADTTVLRVVVRDDRGGVVQTPRVLWSSLSPTIARVDSTGRVEAIAPGTAAIRANVGIAQATATISVAARVPASLTMPATFRVEAGETVSAEVVVRDPTGRVLPGRIPSWSSSALAIASVDAAGLIRGVAPGTAVVTARLDALVASGMVTVLPAAPVARVDVTPASATVTEGRTITLTASPRDAAGRALNGRTVTWTTGNGGVASVAATGVVTGVTPGATVITATVDGRQGSALLAVTPVPVASVSISPAAPTVRVGQSVSLTASARDSGGAPITGRSVVWTSTAPSIVTVSATGVLTGVAEGAASIRAEVEGVVGVVSVQVTTPSVSRVEITPSSPLVSVGGTVQLQATAYDSDGSTIVGRTINWGTSNSTIATVSATGVVTGVAAGTTSISATIGGKTSQASVSVRTIGAVTRIEITPRRAYLLPGETRRLSATAYDANGFVVTGRTVLWTTADATIATASPAGDVRAVGVGTTTATAVVDGRTASTDVLVIPTFGQTVATVRSARVDQGLSYTHSTCALVPTGAAYCWGDNVFGDVGDGTTSRRVAPARVAGGVTFSIVVPGGYHTCGLSTAGSAFCWGRNASGQLGDGTTIDRVTPTAVMGGRRYTQLALGTDHACALDASGQAWCWGSNRAGQLGVGSNTSSSLVPVSPSTTERFVSLSAHYADWMGDHYGAATCGITGIGAVWCWGEALPDGIRQIRYTPIDVSAPVALRSLVDAGFVYSGGYVQAVYYCGLDTQARAWCTTGRGPFAGSSDLGWQQRTGVTPTSLMPPGGRFCGINVTGNAACWAPTGTSAPITLRDQPALVSGSANESVLYGIDANGRLWRWDRENSTSLSGPYLVVIPP